MSQFLTAYKIFVRSEDRDFNYEPIFDCLHTISAIKERQINLFKTQIELYNFFKKFTVVSIE